MKRPGLLLLLLLPALVAAASAMPPASPTRAAGLTIERNLTYLRVHVLPDDLPAAVAGTLVLDLRFVPAGPEAAAAFAGWLKARARPQAPVLVLVNGGTAPGLLALLAAPAVPAGVVSLGPVAMGDGPDIRLELDANADRAAYDAFEHGATMDELINPKMEKIRHDEAAMARDRAAASSVEEEDDLLPVVDKKTPVAPVPAAPAPPVDRVLQRAVQLQHALLALGKIP